MQPISILLQRAVVAAVAMLSAALLPCAQARAQAHANPSAHPFALVMIDDATEAQYGRFPLSRDLTAKVVTKLTQGGARAVVLKFFYDEPRDASVDGALASAMARSVVILQARIDEAITMPNAIAPRFALGVPAGPTVIEGKSGWIPVPVLSNRAAAIGFADATRTDRVPSFVRYQDRAMPSLTVATIAMALGGVTPVIQPGKQIMFGNKTLPLDDGSQILLTPSAFDDAERLGYLSFADVLSDKPLPASLRGKVVVVGYHGSQMHRLSTNAGSLKAHQVFYMGLVDVWSQLK
jgi:adenylate cyclase